MRIAFISDAPALTPADPICGGGHMSVAEVARHLRGFGHDVDVFTRREDPSV
jgi:hypothetical protein